MKDQNFAYHIMNFLSHYLTNENGCSPNTVSSYRQCFILLLEFFKDQKHISPQKVNFKHLSRTAVAEFLDWLESTRGCGISTRNQRLAAINSFLHYVTDQVPDYLFQQQQIQSIPIKKAPEPMIEYLLVTEMQVLLSMPVQAKPSGFRDLVLLSLMYDSAARVQEICDLTPRDIQPEHLKVRLRGKGQKVRIIPVMEKTMKLLRQYMKVNKFDEPEHSDNPLFPNLHKQKMTRAGITYILDKYVKRAKRSQPSLFKGNIHPHCLRHSRAMHMLDSDVPLHYIRDFLGHKSVKTTEVYAKTNQESLRKALEKTHKYEVMPEFSWQKNTDTLAWLKNFGK